MAGDAEDLHREVTRDAIGLPEANSRKQGTHRQAEKALRNTRSCSALTRTVVQAQGAASCIPQ